MGFCCSSTGDDGSIGMGEASPVGAGSREEVEAIGASLGEMAPRLLGTEPSATENPPLPEWNAPPVLRFGIETALLDLRGKALMRNASELLNGVARSLPVNALIAAETPGEAAAEAKDAAGAGFRTIKLKVGLESAKQDEALVSAVRQAVGTEIKVRIDANRKWGLPEAIAGLRRLEQYDIEYVEDPLRRDDTAGLAELRRSVGIPVAVDEALGTADRTQRLAVADSADVLVIKAGRLGGLKEALELMRLAEDRGKGLVVTSSLECGVGLAASVHLAATLTAHPFAHGLATAASLGKRPAFGVVTALEGQRDDSGRARPGRIAGRQPSGEVQHRRSGLHHREAAGVRTSSRNPVTAPSKISGCSRWTACPASATVSKRLVGIARRISRAMLVNFSSSSPATSSAGAVISSSRSWSGG